MKRIIMWFFIIIIGICLVPPSSSSVFAASNSVLLPIETIGSGGITNAGYVNDSGKIVVPLKYESTKDFSEGLGVVQEKKTLRYGAINEKGNLVIPMIFDQLHPFSEGLAAANKNGKWGFIDTKGRWIVEPIYPWVSSYKEAVAAVQSPVTHQYGFITRLGEWIVPPVFDTASPFSEELALVSRTKEDKKEYLFINKRAELSIMLPSPTFEEGYRVSGIAPVALSFKEGLAPVLKDDKVGFIDSTGTWMIDPAFDYALPFSEGLAAVYMMDEQKWGFINKDGEVVIEPSFSYYLAGIGEASIGSFHEGLAYVGDGFINREGHYVIHGNLFSSTNFHNGIARVIKLTNDEDGHIDKGYEQYINQKGEVIWDKELPYVGDIIHRSRMGGYNYAFYEDNQ